MVAHHTNDGAVHLSSDYAPRSSPLTGFPEPPPWMADANCASTDPEAFFPEKGGSTREAKKVCSRCTVAAECLDWALNGDERFGIWGGMSERDRRRLSRHAGWAKTCRYLDCNQPTWSKSASYCETHRPFHSAIHEEKEPA